MSLQYSGKIISAGSALNTVGTVPVGTGKTKDASFYVHFGPGTSAGAVVIEGAPHEGFTGTWALLQTINWAAADRAHNYNVTGSHGALRARISVAIVGGTVDVYANLNR